MRILLVGAGAPEAIGDVEAGYRDALEHVAGVEMRYYNLTARIGVARQWVQRLWRMRGKPEDQRPSWPEAIYRSSVEALEMALRYQVDWMVVVSGMFFHPDVLILCARAGVKTSIILTESPYQDDDQSRLGSLADVVWTNERTSIDRLGLEVPNIRYLPGAYSPIRHTPEIPVGDDLPEHDVVFVGTGFRERIDMLMRVNWKGIDLGLYGEWSLLGPTAKLRDFVKGPVLTNKQTVQLYRRAKIGLNLYRTSTTYGQKTPRIAHAESMNPRAYELAACEVFSISEPRAELVERLGDAVPTFSSPAELECLIRTYVNHSPERRRLARLARQRILPHTFAARAAQLLADLEAFERPRSLGRAS